jgi:hypothetical protein
VFPVRYEMNLYILCRRNSHCKFDFDRVNAGVQVGSNTFTIVLRVVGGDE